MTQATWERDQLGQSPTIVSQNFARSLTPSFARQLVQQYMHRVTLISAEFGGDPCVYEPVLSISRVLKGRVQVFSVFAGGDDAGRRICFRRGTWNEVRGTLPEVLRGLQIETLFLTDFHAEIHSLVNRAIIDGLQQCRMSPRQDTVDDPWSEMSYSFQLQSCLLEGSYFCETSSNTMVEDSYADLQRLSDELTGLQCLTPDAGTFRISYRDGPVVLPAPPVPQQKGPGSN